MARARPLAPETAAILVPLGPPPGPPAPPLERPEVRTPVVFPAVSLPRALARLARWYAVGTITLGLILMDRAKGLTSNQQVGVRLRQCFERMGATAVKLGQQLSVRHDLLPSDVCNELSLLTDRNVPIPLEEAVAAIEESLGVPLHSVFPAFDPKPIGAASVACVYKARVKSGEVVAVKVQRPGIAHRFAEDLFAFRVMTRMAEIFTFVRADFFRDLRIEITSMFAEEMDFRREARYQRVYMRIARRDRLKWVTAPKVYSELSGERILVTEFCLGIPSAELISAHESQDRKALAHFSSLNIEPATVADHLFMLQCWGTYEQIMFHGDPHPANIMLLPDSRICMLDFGACGVISEKMRQVNMEIVRCNVTGDITGLSDAGWIGSEPIPCLDSDWMRREMLKELSDVYLSMVDPKADWSERGFGRMWLGLVQAAQRLELPITLETLRVMRASLLYSSLAGRLKPSLGVRDNERFLRESDERARRARARRERRRMGDLPRAVYAQLRARETERQVQRLVSDSTLLSTNLLASFQELSSTWSAIGGLLVNLARLGGVALLFGGLWLLGARVGVWAPPVSITHPLGGLLDLLRRPDALLIGANLLCLLVLRLRHRLGELRS